MQALQERQSQREFRLDPLPEQSLSDLLWAAFGINRPENDHRTAPSAMNTQDIDLYVATAEGLYVYEAKPHGLRKVAGRDLRLLTTGQDPLKPAPVQLIYVSDFARMPKVPVPLRELYAGIDAGAIVQNVYLFCASAGLATVVHELDREPLAKALALRPEQRIILAQAVGIPP
jgi:nitroreductase